MKIKATLIKNARIVNEGKIIEGDILIENDIIKEVSESISAKSADVNMLLMLKGIMCFQELLMIKFTLENQV